MISNESSMMNDSEMSIDFSNLLFLQKQNPGNNNSQSDCKVPESTQPDKKAPKEDSGPLFEDDLFSGRYLSGRGLELSTEAYLDQLHLNLTSGGIDESPEGYDTFFSAEASLCEGRGGDIRGLLLGRVGERMKRERQGAWGGEEEMAEPGGLNLQQQGEDASERFFEGQSSSEVLLNESVEPYFFQVESEQQQYFPKNKVTLPEDLEIFKEKKSLPHDSSDGADTPARMKYLSRFYQMRGGFKVAPLENPKQSFFSPVKEVQSPQSFHHRPILFGAKRKNSSASGQSGSQRSDTQNKQMPALREEKKTPPTSDFGERYEETKKLLRAAQENGSNQNGWNKKEEKAAVQSNKSKIGKNDSEVKPESNQQFGRNNSLSSTIDLTAYGYFKDHLTEKLKSKLTFSILQAKEIFNKTKNDSFEVATSNNPLKKSSNQEPSRAKALSSLVAQLLSKYQFLTATTLMNGSPETLLKIVPPSDIAPAEKTAFKLFLKRLTYLRKATEEKEPNKSENSFGSGHSPSNLSEVNPMMTLQSPNISFSQPSLRFSLQDENSSRPPRFQTPGFGPAIQDLQMSQKLQSASSQTKTDLSSLKYVALLYRDSLARAQAEQEAEESQASQNSEISPGVNIRDLHRLLISSGCDLDYFPQIVYLLVKHSSRDRAVNKEYLPNSSFLG